MDSSLPETLVTILIMAKSPKPGFVKTRLCPPCTPEQAAAVAAAALFDTIDAASATGLPVVLAYEGHPIADLPANIQVFPQSGDSFAERLTHAWSSIDTPAVQIAMDTPQVQPAALLHAFEETKRVGSALGPSEDGGWWIIGFATPPAPAMFHIEMSTAMTGSLQLRQLQQHGYEVADLPVLRDVDSWEDAREVAALVPDNRFGRIVESIGA